jgi:hypothetical protein
MRKAGEPTQTRLHQIEIEDVITNGGRCLHGHGNFRGLAGRHRPG